MPDDRLEEDRRDGVGALVADDVLEPLQALLDRPRLLLAPAVGVRVADDPDEPRLVGPAARVAGQGHRPEGRAVVGAVAGEDLVPAGVVAGELDRVLDRLGAAEREEDLVQVAGQDLGHLRAEPAADLRREARHDVLELLRLLGDRVDDPPVAVADVHGHQLAVEVEDPPALGRVQVDALGMIDRDRVERTWTDHEKKVCARFRATISSLVMREVVDSTVIDRLLRGDRRPLDHARERALWRTQGAERPQSGAGSLPRSDGRPSPRGCGALAHRGA